MSTVRIQNTIAGGLVTGNLYTGNGELGSTAAVFGSASDSCVFGHNGVNGAAYLFIFQGSAPSDFSTFTSISTRISDLLISIPMQYAVGVTGSNSQRWLVGASNGTSRTSTITNAAGSLVRSSNVVTVTVPVATAATIALVPGQTITISGVTTDTSFNGTFTVASVPSTTTFTFNQSGSNASVNGTSGTITIPYTAQLSGTATWFCMCRTNTSWIPTYAFTNYGAMIGTVGVAGSGADLEIVSTSITAGSTYTSAGMYINMPYDWTF